MGGQAWPGPPASHPQHGGAAGPGEFGGVFLAGALPNRTSQRGWHGWHGALGGWPGRRGRRGPDPRLGGGGSSWELLLVKAGAEKGLSRTSPRSHLGFSSRRRWRRWGGRGPAGRAAGGAEPGAAPARRARGARRTGTAPAPRTGVAPRTESRTRARTGRAPAAGRGAGPAAPAAPASRAAPRAARPGQSPPLLSPGAAERSGAWAAPRAAWPGAPSPGQR